MVPGIKVKLNWPLSREDLSILDKHLVPQWSPFWKRFGWDNWEKAQRWNVFKDRITFHDVPQYGYVNGELFPDRTILFFTHEGQDITPKSQYSDSYVVCPMARRACQEKISEIRPKLKLLLGDFYVRFGEWGEVSTNWLTGKEELGVSAYRVFYDLDTDRWAIDESMQPETIGGTLSDLFYGDRPCWLVQGREVGEGSDGEPLLAHVTKVAELDRGRLYMGDIL